MICQSSMLPSTKLEFRAPAIHHYRLCMPIFNEYATTAIFLPKKPPIVVNMRLFSDCCFAAWFFVMQMSLLFSELFSPWNDISSNMTLSHKKNVVVVCRSIVIFFETWIFLNRYSEIFVWKNNYIVLTSFVSIDIHFHITDFGI